VTQPIEIALMGASGVQAVRSQSTAGLNVIYIEFDWDTDIKTARQTVQERLTTLGSILPEGILPQMTPPASIMGQIVVAGIYRQQGPNEGELYPIDKTSLLMELTIDDLRLPIDRGFSIDDFRFDFSELPFVKFRIFLVNPCRYNGIKNGIS